MSTASIAQQRHPSWREQFDKNRLSFFAWLLSVTAFGTLGVWVPALVSWLADEPVTRELLMLTGSLSTFSIVILVEGLLAGVLNKQVRIASWMSIVVLLLMLVDSIVYSLISTNVGVNFNKDKACLLVGILALLSTVVAVVLYKYKSIEIDEGAEAYLNRDNTDMEKGSAQLRTDDNPVI